MTDEPIEQLIHLIAKLPGLGRRSARRVVLHLIKQKEGLMLPLSEALGHTARTIITCEQCGNLDTQSPCHICNDHKRLDNVLCVVEEVTDLWAIERSNIYRGRYHVLGGTLSALDGRGPDQLSIHTLIDRAGTSDIAEIILATNATVDGQTTAHYIMERLKPLQVQVTRLAHGIPIGGELDYLDDGTLNAALQARK